MSPLYMFASAAVLLALALFSGSVTGRRLFLFIGALVLIAGVLLVAYPHTFFSLIG